MLLNFPMVASASTSRFVSATSVGGTAVGGPAPQMTVKLVIAFLFITKFLIDRRERKREHYRKLKNNGV